MTKEELLIDYISYHYVEGTITNVQRVKMEFAVPSYLQKIEQLTIPVVSTRTFENECELYVDAETDEWVLKHKGVIKKRAKSKFECLLTKQEIKKRLVV